MRLAFTKQTAIISVAGLLALYVGASLAKRYTSQQLAEVPYGAYIYIFKDGKAIGADAIRASKIELVNPEKIRVATGTNGWLGSLGPQTHCQTFSSAILVPEEDKNKPFVYWVKGDKIKTAHLPEGFSVSFCDRPLPVSLTNNIEFPATEKVRIGEQ